MHVARSRKGLLGPIYSLFIVHLLCIIAAMHTAETSGGGCSCDPPARRRGRGAARPADLRLTTCDGGGGSETEEERAGVADRAKRLRRPQYAAAATYIDDRSPFHDRIGFKRTSPIRAPSREEGLSAQVSITDGSASPDRDKGWLIRQPCKSTVWERTNKFGSAAELRTVKTVKRLRRRLPACWSSPSSSSSSRLMEQ